MANSQHFPAKSDGAQARLAQQRNEEVLHNLVITDRERRHIQKRLDQDARRWCPRILSTLFLRIKTNEHNAFADIASNSFQ